MRIRTADLLITNQSQTLVKAFQRVSQANLNSL